jgi:hypothetical protein
MEELPILYTGAMVRALLDDRKQQTRGIMNPQPQMTRPRRRSWQIFAASGNPSTVPAAGMQTRGYGLWNFDMLLNR